jgi:tRNA pseudouridine38-40 synthase
MYNYLIALRYFGRNFHGWQIQPNAPTVQEAIEKALSVVLRNKITIIGAGRTDTGVNASFYIANFVCETKISDNKKLIKSLNGYLKNDISILDIFEVPQNFNSRFDAISRTYYYFISKHKNPFIEHFSLYFPLNLEIKEINSAANLLFEYQDFSSFQRLHSDNKTNICKIFEAKWTETENLYYFKIKADRFLRNMVRSIVGTMLDVGQKKIDIQQFRQIIESKNRSAAGVSVLPHGLFLADIQYPKQINDFLESSREKAKILWI